MYRLRWVFYYTDGKVKRGVWNGTSPRLEDTAVFQNKNNLLVAAIEGEDINGNLKTFLEIDGKDYVSSTWERIVRLPMMGANIKTSGKLVGLSFYTPTEKITVNTDGKISRRILSDREKRFKNFREHTYGNSFEIKT